MIMNSVANRVETVVVADMKTITKIYHICHTFTCDALYLVARETKCNVICDFLWNGWFYNSCCRCLSGGCNC